jgi:hypothetical protein
MLDKLEGTAMKKHTIEVRAKDNGIIFKTIRRVLRAEAIGNFNPIFCTYLGKRHLVLSDEGDLSDPFRRDESYLATLYINL